MTDWKALWHTHQDYRTGYTTPVDNPNDLGQELQARLIKPAADALDIAVYRQDRGVMILGNEHGWQLLSLQDNMLFSIRHRLCVEQRQDQGLPGYRVEVTVSHATSGEQASWHGAIRHDEQGQPWLENQLLAEGIMPEMPFDQLSFTDHARFRDLLYSRWQHFLPTLRQELAQSGQASHASRSDQVRQLARYQALVRHEQAGLVRLFSEQEQQWLQQALDLPGLDQPAHCRGLWLRLEEQIPQAPASLDTGQLLHKMRALSYAQELALLEAIELTSCRNRAGKPD
jgi:hypothetical protein